jgi:hypothetical protein
MEEKVKAIWINCLWRKITGGSQPAIIMPITWGMCMKIDGGSSKIISKWIFFDPV